jgi:signal peptidase I
MSKWGSSFTVKAQGSSMHPLLQDGDVIKYKYIKFEDIRVNDIVLIYINEVMMTHRVIYKTSAFCITRGDNNPTSDPTIKRGSVLARAIEFKRNGVWYGIQDTYITQSMLYLHEIQRVGDTFLEKKIPHVFLKGVLVSLRYEGQIPQRIYADCDILVQKNSYRSIDKSFKNLGYHLQGRSLLFLNKKKPEDQPEVSYVKFVKGVPVVFDVHFEPVFLMTQLEGMNLLYPKKLLHRLGQEIMQKSNIVNVKNIKFSLCSPTYQVLYLTLHIFHHNFTDASRYKILDSVIRKSLKNKIWNDLREIINEYKLNGYIYLVFILLRKHYKTPISRSFLKSIEPTFLKKMICKFLLTRINIFNQDTRLKAGVERFILIFLLSPKSFWIKFFIIFHKDTIKSLIGVLLTKAKLLFMKKNNKK